MKLTDILLHCFCHMLKEKFHYMQNTGCLAGQYVTAEQYFVMAISINTIHAIYSGGFRGGARGVVAPSFLET